MIPSHYVRVDQIPMNVNGKVDRDKLIQNLQVNKAFFTKDIQITDEIENKIYTIISNLAKTRDFSLDENFFEVGINSIHIVEIYHHLMNAFQIDNFEVVDLFEYTTVRKIAALIKKQKKQPSTQVNRAELRLDKKGKKVR